MPDNHWSRSGEGSARRPTDSYHYVFFLNSVYLVSIALLLFSSSVFCNFRNRFTIRSTLASSMRTFTVKLFIATFVWEKCLAPILTNETKFSSVASGFFYIFCFRAERGKALPVTFTGNGTPNYCLFGLVIDCREIQDPAKFAVGPLLLPTRALILQVNCGTRKVWICCAENNWSGGLLRLSVLHLLCRFPYWPEMTPCCWQRPRLIHLICSDAQLPVKVLTTPLISVSVSAGYVPGETWRNRNCPEVFSNAFSSEGTNYFYFKKLYEKLKTTLSHRPALLSASCFHHQAYKHSHHIPQFWLMSCRRLNRSPRVSRWGASCIGGERPTLC